MWSFASVHLLVSICLERAQKYILSFKESKKINVKVYHLLSEYLREGTKFVQNMKSVYCE